MKALLFHGSKDIRLESEWPDPVPVMGEVKLRMTCTSICATDIERWHGGGGGRRRNSQSLPSNWMMPVIPGHEAAGEVVELGDGVAALKVGDRVAVENIGTCGECFWCRNGEASSCSNSRNFGFSDHGGFAEFAVWPERLCIPLPESITNEEAPLAEPTSVAVHAVRRSGVKVGDSAVVIGCGAVGLLTLQVLRAAGASVIAIDRRAVALEMASQLGAFETLDSTRVDPGEVLPEITSGIGPDLIFETAGAPETPVQAVQWVRRGGTAVTVGLSGDPPVFDFRQVTGPERTVIGSSGAGSGDYRRALGLIATGRVNVKPLISSRIPLDRVVEDGFEAMLNPNSEVFRIVVGPG